MKFSNVRKAVAILLLFALLFSAFPLPVVANGSGNTEETAAKEDAVTAETNTGPTDGCL